MGPLKTGKGPTTVQVSNRSTQVSKSSAHLGIYYTLAVILIVNILPMMELSDLRLASSLNQTPRPVTRVALVASAFSVGRFGWPGLEWREIIDWWTSGYSRGVVIGRNYIPPCKLCDMPRMFRVD